MLFDLGWAVARVCDGEDDTGAVIVLFTPEREAITLRIEDAREGLEALLAHISNMDVGGEVPPCDQLTEPDPDLSLPALVPPADDLHEDSESFTASPTSFLLSQELPTRKPLTFDDI